MRAISAYSCVLQCAFNGFVLFVFYACCAGPATAAVGEAVLVRNDVKATPVNGQARQMTTGEPIDLGFNIVTGEKSAARMNFVPQGTLTLGASTHLSIDQPTVDRATGRQTSKLALGVGWLRVELNHHVGDLEVDTPSAVVGIKGTVLNVLVDPSGKTTIVLQEGDGLVRCKATGQVVDVPPGQFTVIQSSGCPPTPPQPIDTSTQTLLDQAVVDAGGPIPGVDPLIVPIGLSAAAAAAIAEVISATENSDHHSRRTVSP